MNYVKYSLKWRSKSKLFLFAGKTTENVLFVAKLYFQKTVQLFCLDVYAKVSFIKKNKPYSGL